MVEVELPNPTHMERVPQQVRVSFDVAEFEERSDFVRLKAVNFPGDSSASLSDSLVAVRYMVREEHADTLGSLKGFEVTADYKAMHRADSSILPTITTAPSGAFMPTIDSVRIKVSYGN